MTSSKIKSILGHVESGRKEDDMSAYRHLDLSKRIRIESLLTDRYRVSEIARILSRDPKTIRDEILRNRSSLLRGSYGKRANPCKYRDSCEHKAGDICQVCLQVHTQRLCRYCGECAKDKRCPTFEEEVCSQLDKAPFVCNGCKKQSVCRLRRYVYRAQKAQYIAENRARESRRGICATLEELEGINEIVSSGVRAGQSLNHILANNKDDSPCSDRTVYAYIDQGLLDVKNVDLHEKVTRKPPRKKRVHKVDSLCYQGRSYSDYLRYRVENPQLSVVQMDCIQGLIGEPKTILNLFLPQF